MPTHSLLPFVNSPDGIAQDILISNNASIPGPCSTITPHSTYTEKMVLQSGEGEPLSCMFCDQTFSHQDELGPHVLTQHPTTFFEPTVLRIEAEFKIPGERPRPKPGSLPAEGEEIHRCIVCGQEAQDASELEAHMRKHKDYFTYCCNVCGRRFRESWFLKNHMKMHVRPGPKSKALQDLESPFTINGVIQEPASEPVLTVYKMCMVCGFFFPDHDSLVEHSKVHNRETEQGKDEAVDGATESFVNQESFLYSLNLQPASTGSSLKNVRSAKWIPQLDPFNTYQAWQLATKGKIAVGLNSTKDTGQEVSTDNEDCGSDKEEMGIIWFEGQGDKAVNEVLGRELRSQQQAVVESPNPPKRSLMQKDKDKDRPTTCEECQRTFRTYHQLVLHSRVHKRERPGGESPTSPFDAKMPRMDSMDPAEEGHEEATEENLIAGEDDFDRSKARSKECNYCGKSFRSSYYLTVHMRTHTGEKPYKCAYCDYAAAQKTSLKYHLDRRHKDKPYMKIPIRPVPSLPSLHDRNGNDNDSPAPNGSKLWVPEDRLCTNEAPEDRFDSLGSKLGRPLVQVNTEYDDPLIRCPIAVNLKKEKEDIHDENSEVPLNLSLKVSLSIPAREETKYALSPISCSLCAYRTMYPEVLMMHKKLIHKDKSDSTKMYRLGGSIKQNRYTGCPPALNGKDVTPLLMTDRSYPRRTKSPPPQPTKPQESTSVSSTYGPKSLPTCAPQLESVKETQRYRQNADLHPNQEPHRYTELIRKTSAGNRFVMDRTCPLDKVGLGERSYQARSGAFWPSDAARLCLSSRFGSLPQVDFGEPSGKRLKFSVPTSGKTETGDKAGSRGPTGDGMTRLQITGRSVKPTSLGPGPSTASDALCPIKTISTPLDRGLDSEWSMMNLLRSCTPSNLASLYHSTPTNSAHGGLPNPGAGSRTRLYQQLPGLPTLQRRDPSGVFSNHRYGNTDQSS